MKSVSREEQRAHSQRQGRLKVHQLRGEWEYNKWKIGKRSGDWNQGPYSDEEGNVATADVEVNITRIRPQESYAKFKGPVNHYPWWNI